MLRYLWQHAGSSTAISMTGVSLDPKLRAETEDLLSAEQTRCGTQMSLVIRYIYASMMIRPPPSNDSLIHNINH